MSTPWAYRKGSSPLHRAPAGAKLIFLLCLSLASFFPDLIVLSVIVIIMILLSLAAGLNPVTLLRGSAPLIITVLGVFLLQAVEFFPLEGARLESSPLESFPLESFPTENFPIGFSVDGFREAAIFCVRIAVAFSAGALLFAVTSTSEIKKALSKAEKFLHLGKLNLSLYLSLMLGFLPRFFEIWEDLNLAYKSRGGKNNLSRLVILIPLAVEKMIQKAAETAEALEARGVFL